MFERFSARLRSFFSGRYGADALGRALLIFAVVLMVLGVVGEYLGKIILILNKTPQYVVREIVGAEDAKK